MTPNARARHYSTARFSGAILVLTVFLSCSAIAEKSGGELIGGTFNLLNHHNEPVTEKDFLGKFMLVYFGYTYCPDVCPTDLQIMSEALRMVDPAIARDITPVFVSIDPERDTVALMAQYIRHFHKNLIGLTGTVDQVRAIKSKYRVYSAKSDNTANYLVDHTAYTYLMNKDGTLLKHFNHALPPEKMAKQIMALAR
ncbi:SCO family protein [Pseudomonadales bacterium]|jgi:cytochrome oxidase Cu insertion factor (SCO1/SenC/PrrC family)|nr:SCO family protein [Pseudomonadales bacterium]